MSDKAPQSGQETGKISDNDIARAKRQIGVPKFSRNKPYNEIASPDGMRHFAFACGDSNPLFNDRDYGK
ncbi:MAG: hypothetical protein P8M73_01200, partial [Luminiphilus sp.]|nr:hypothetical protein [Luminiphilus sp.]